VDPVPDPPIFFSGSAGNRTRASGSVANHFHFYFLHYQNRDQWWKYGNETQEFLKIFGTGRFTTVFRNAPNGPYPEPDQFS
jgi:hypothetical protein